MEAVIVNFKIGKRTKSDNQMIVKVDGVSNKEKAGSLVGKHAVWKSPAGKEIKGVVRAAHGNKGAVRVLFETGMPGQAIGKKVSLA